MKQQFCSLEVTRHRLQQVKVICIFHFALVSSFSFLTEESHPISDIDKSSENAVTSSNVDLFGDMEQIIEEPQSTSSLFSQLQEANHHLVPSEVQTLGNIKASCPDEVLTEDYLFSSIQNISHEFWKIANQLHLKKV